MGELRNEILVWNIEGKTPLVIPRCRREENVKMDHKKCDMNIWTGFCLVEDRVQSCERGNEPSVFTKGEDFLDQPSDY
jgi:hypothetical protein